MVSGVLSLQPPLLCVRRLLFCPSPRQRLLLSGLRISLRNSSTFACVLVLTWSVPLLGPAGSPFELPRRRLFPVAKVARFGAPAGLDAHFMFSFPSFLGLLRLYVVECGDGRGTIRRRLRRSNPGWRG